MKNIPKKIHLIPTSEGEDSKAIKDFDKLDHEFTYWAAGTRSKETDLNYVQQKQVDALKSKINILLYQMDYKPTINAEKKAYKKLLKLLK